MNNKINYGPLEQFIGLWKGDKGIDISPEPDGHEESPYYETVEYFAVGHAKNAGAQVLAVIRYHQVVKRKSDDSIFHDQVGYWMWDENTNIVMHSLTIPRAVCVLAGGVYKNEKTDTGDSIIEVTAAVDHEEWGIIQSPFMEKNAKTVSFLHRVILGGLNMTYKSTTMLNIYGKVFEHTDENILTRQ